MERCSSCRHEIFIKRSSLLFYSLRCCEIRRFKIRKTRKEEKDIGSVGYLGCFMFGLMNRLGVKGETGCRILKTVRLVDTCKILLQI